MQLYLRKLYNIFRQQKKIDWTIEHRKRFDETKTLLTEQIINTIQIQTNHSTQCAMPPTLESAQHFYNLIKI